MASAAVAGVAAEPQVPLEIIKERKRRYSVAFQFQSTDSDELPPLPLIDNLSSELAVLPPRQAQYELNQEEGVCECDAQFKDASTQADLLITSSSELLNRYVETYDAKNDLVYPNVRYAQLQGPMIMSKDSWDDSSSGREGDTWHLSGSLDPDDISQLQRQLLSKSFDAGD